MRLLLTVPAILAFVSEPAAQDRIPEILERSLSSVSGLSTTISCRVSFDALVPESELQGTWGVHRTRMRTRLQTYALRGERFRVQQTGQSIPGSAAQPLQTEMVFDGAEVRFAHGRESVLILTLQDALRRYSSNAELCSTDYFDAARIGVPGRADRLGSLPTSLTLQSLYAGAKLESKSDEAWIVREVVSKSIHRVCWLDPKRNFAVVRSELFAGESLLETTRASRFVEVGPVFLPQRIEIQRFSFEPWTRISNRPLARSSIAVTAIRSGATPADLRPAPRASGSVVLDARQTGNDATRSGYSAYRVAVPAEELVDAFDAKSDAAERAREIHWAHGLLAWATWHALALLAFRVAVGVRFPKSGPRQVRA